VSVCLIPDVSEFYLSPGRLRDRPTLGVRLTAMAKHKSGHDWDTQSTILILDLPEPSFRSALRAWYFQRLTDSITFLPVLVVLDDFRI
jgi:hypothetical protein